MNNVMQSFLEVLHEHGLAPEEIIADGNLHRCPTLEKPRKRNGAYIAHMDKPVTLVVQLGNRRAGNLLRRGKAIFFAFRVVCMAGTSEGHKTSTRS